MENPANDHKEFYTENQLTVILSDLFLAGSETTGKSLEWGCLFMLLNPEVNMIQATQLAIVMPYSVKNPKNLSGFFYLKNIGLGHQLLIMKFYEICDAYQIH